MKRIAGLFAVSLALIEVLVDATTWIQLNISIVYGLPLVLAAITGRRAFLWTLAVLLLCSTFIVYFVQDPKGPISIHEEYFVNRVLAAVSLVLTAILLHMRILFVARLESQRRHIALQNRELERRRREAEEASGRKSQLLASVSHDIRTPVNTISLMAEVIRRSAGDPALADNLPGLAQRLQGNAHSLGKLLSDVLDLAHIDSGRMERHETLFDLGALLKEQTGGLLALAEAKKIDLRAQAPQRELWLRADRGVLVRVLSNLIANGIKYTEAGSVTVSAECSPQGVRIRVRDTGIGIAPESQQYIFEEFRQVPGPAGRTGNGWGLGLAICWRLVVEQLRGTLTLESEPGRGSVFTIGIPADCVLDHHDSGRTQVPGEVLNE